MESPSKVSVVIPVYNARDYVRQAVESVLAEPETGEVLLIEDASPDGALQVCQQLASEYDRVRVFQHPGGENRGAAASRNLGIKKARFSLVAFLDADDEALPGRFRTAVEILDSQPDIDGVYEAVRFDCVNEQAYQEWHVRAPVWCESGLVTPLKVFPPEQLWDAFMHEEPVFFHNNGVTVRKSALERIGGYTNVRRTEDLVFCHKLAAKCRMLAGRLDDPVATYRVYGSNRGSRVHLTPLQVKYRSLIPGDALWLWSIDNLTPEQEAAYFDYLMKFLRHIAKEYPRYLRRLYLLQAVFRRVIKRPRILRRRYLYRALR